jgi:hypothetical protein
MCTVLLKLQAEDMIEKNSHYQKLRDNHTCTSLYKEMSGKALERKAADDFVAAKQETSSKIISPYILCFCQSQAEKFGFDEDTENVTF